MSAAWGSAWMLYSAEAVMFPPSLRAPPLHDPCVILWLLVPGIFTLRPCHLAIETLSDLTLGHTAVEFRTGPHRPANARWATAADAEAAFARIEALLERYG